MQTDILRQKYLNFFKKKNHRLFPSSSLVPENDPTLLFTSAGMNQFKEELRGNVGDFRRATTCQKCLRTDDLEKVGKTAAHHTFFEMLGNFSFGDYFKKEAIAWAWEFLLKELNLPKEKLWISVYKDDDEAFKIWRHSIGVPVEKIVRLGDADNFWPSDAIKNGPNGPCGPCSEIFYDEGEDKGCRRKDCSPACSCGRFIEIWNLVFTQFERKETGKLEPLPNKNIDTGMGLERMASVMQGVATNFEIDIFRPIVDFVCQETRTDYENELRKMVDVYCIADHIRAATFAICENCLPSNEERGYVIRKIIRKSLMHLRNLSKEETAFLYKIVPIIARVMQEPYPELAMRQENISLVILAEEKRFADILKNSEGLIESKFSSGDISDSGKIAFELYDTFGMPLEVTREFARRIFNLEIDEKSFNEYMNRQKNLSKAGSQMKGNVFVPLELKPLSGIKKTEFTGYEMTETESEVILIIQDGERKSVAGGGKKFSVILEKSPFYGERGGQVGDHGVIEGKRGSVFKVEDTQVYNDIIIHEGYVIDGAIKASDKVTAKVDRRRRMSVARHHTATHLLQSALRKVLGEHIEQAGSFVGEDRLRFDFMHFKSLNETELREIENTVNEYIKNNFTVEVKVLKRQEALRLGAIALFGEKYQERVRVVVIDEISKEFCGGTHLHSTGETKLFRVVKESAIAAGVRRIEAVCGEAALEKEKELKNLLDEISEWLGVDVKSIFPAVEKAEQKLRDLEKEINRLKDKNISAKIEEITACAVPLKNTALLIRKFSGFSAELLRSIADNLTGRLESCITVLASMKEGKINLIISVSQDNINKGIGANVIVKDIAKLLGGSGGGRADFAQAGAKEKGDLDRIIRQIPEIIGGYLK